MNFRADKEASHEEVEKAVREGEYPRTWELYRQWSDEGYVETEHEVGFSGADWDYVMEKNKDALLDTFKMSTADEMELQSRHVGELQPTVDEKGVSFGFSLKHPKEWTQKEVDEKLKNCAYTAVWELYETRPYDPSRTTVTAHEITFEGEDWDYTLEKKRADVETAFKEDVAERLGVAPTAVTEVQPKRTEKGITLSANVQHPTVMDKDMVAEELRQGSYPRTWKCYTKKPTPVPRAAPPPAKGLSSQFAREFDGLDWDVALKERGEKVKQSFIRDTADVIQTTPEHVVVDSVETSGTGSLIVAYRIRHLQIREENALSLTDNYAYPLTWSQYHSRERDGGPLPVTPRRRSGSRPPQ
ncbi:hypothetical protein ADEAN_000880900 [Angomonas deanei]|uniref:Flagellar attachment zone protein 1 conserved domain-containing protein n=1 Tax=Angomonas deanei TaxID=59799 RepID=A0A7G2CQ82_9TRYP|nr:hypothetical protein ADEAN_000880900 [Angomonas deanei]